MWGLSGSAALGQRWAGQIPYTTLTNPIRSCLGPNVNRVRLHDVRHQPVDNQPGAGLVVLQEVARPPVLKALLVLPPLLLLRRRSSSAQPPRMHGPLHM